VTTNGIDQLRSKGASADIMSHYVDAHGRVVDEELDARTISVDLDGVKVRDDGATVAPGLGAYWSSHPEPKKQRLWG
jgi:Transcriptional regulator, contains sigma factor-related N-terminal domain